MNLQHLNAKIFVKGELSVDWAQFIEVFHRWIAERSLGELLIDVADYRHVPHGPGVVLVGHEADYAMDNQGGRAGLRYNRKAPLAGNNEDRVRHAIASACTACNLLEGEFADLKFDRQKIELFVNDRALAPNDEATRDTFQAELPPILKKVLGVAVRDLTYQRDPRCLVGVVAELPSSVDFASLSTA